MAEDIDSEDTNCGISLDDELSDIINEYKNHDSVAYIRNHNLNKGLEFHFQEVSEEHILNLILKMNVRKSTGYDCIPAKLLRYGAETLCYPIQILVNRCINECIFPANAKKAEVIPIYKKKDNLDKANYRPVSVLSSLSKLFETIIVDQLSRYFNDIFSSDMSGFRKNHGCQNLLLKFVEDISSAI